MTLVSLTDCCHLLAIDPKTLHRWMSRSHLSAQSHPLDARCKCLSSGEIQQLATTHHRALPDLQQLSGHPEVLPLTVPTLRMGIPPVSDIPPDFGLQVLDLTQQLSTLQAEVVLLQHQLTLLSAQLQEEQQWRASQTRALLDKSLDKSPEDSKDLSLESSGDLSPESSPDKSSESSLDLSLEPSPDKESACSTKNSPKIDRRKHSHVLPLVEYGGVEGKYVVISPEQGLLDFEPDSPEWFAWLSTQMSFRFVGVSGYLTVHRNGCSPRWTWRGTRSIRSRSHSLHLVRTEFLTSAVLEQAAASLQSLLN